MNDWFYPLALWFLELKATLSTNKAKEKPFHRRPIPKLGSVGSDGLVSLDVARKINQSLQKLQYIADPQTFDYYTDPEILQYAMETGDYQGLSCDCDDTAGWAKKGLQACGVKDGDVWLWSMVMSAGYVNPLSLINGQMIQEFRKNHVVCGFRVNDGNRDFVGVIDTNSVANGEPYWFPGQPAQVEQAVKEHFGRIYGTHYGSIVVSKYPF